MPRESQAARINLLIGLVEQLALHLATLVKALIPESEEVEAAIMEIATMANQLTDSRFATLINESVNKESE